MSIPGFVDYQRREYCKDVACPIQNLLDKESDDSDAYDLIRTICTSDCIHSTYEFHHWLTDKGYLIVRKEE